MDVPRTLEELLEDFSDLDGGDVDAAVDGNRWAKKFAAHLSDRDLTDEVIAFKFLIYTQPVADFAKKSAKKKAAKSDAVRKIVTNCGALFLSEESEDQLCLSNPDLAEMLRKTSATLRASRSKADPSREEINLVLRARGDPDVWANGVEPKFMRFLAQQPRGAVACLLSIL